MNPLGLFLAALPLLAQTAPSVPTPGAPAQSTSATSTFYAVGVSGLAQTSPKPSVWGAFAVPAKSTWAITEVDVNYIKSGKQIQPSVRSGVATECSIGQVKLFCWGAAGVATTGSATTGAYSGGIIWLRPVSPSSKLKWIVAARALKTAATGAQFILSVGLGTGGMK